MTRSLPIRRVAILGSTGSIGTSALSVVDAHATRLKVIGLAAGRNAGLFAEQVARYRPCVVAMEDGAGLDGLRARVPGGNYRVAGTGTEGLVGVATHPEVDIVLCASSGTAALEAVLAAIEAGKTIALANKEVLVMAGGLMTESARRHGVAILPVDSEHNAIHQCLHGHDPGDVRRLILTASGGPFRRLAPGALDTVGPEEALRHPTWQMGRKITIDSATLMNKGLEVIEAHWLFGVPAEAIDVVIHPQSVVHSMVEFADGSILAQLGVTDMRLPIQYAFSYPARWASPVARLDLAAAGCLEFHLPNHEAFPCLRLAYRALANGGGLPVVLNAANEVAVARFLEGRLAFTAIPRVIEQSMDAHAPVPVKTLAEVRAIDTRARRHADEAARALELKA